MSPEPSTIRLLLLWGLVGLEVGERPFEVLNAEQCEGRRGRLMGEVNEGETAVFRRHVRGDVPQQSLVFAHHPGHAGDGKDVARLGYGQASRSVVLALDVAQCQGSKSSRRLTGYPVMHACTSAGLTCRSASLIFTLTVML